MADMKWIIGCGTGRCGTSTLAHLLNNQDGARVTHERFTYNLHWGKMDGWMQKMIDASKKHDGHLYGDVALQWGSVAADWLDYGAQLVVMKRDLKSYLESWKYKAGRRNNWQPVKEGGTPGRSRWYNGFPNFSGCSSKEEALTRFWHFYYEELIPPLVDAYPGQVGVFRLATTFNTEAGQHQLLTFCGITPHMQRLQVGLKKNKRRKKK